MTIIHNEANNDDVLNIATVVNHEITITNSSEGVK